LKKSSVLGIIYKYLTLGWVRKFGRAAVQIECFNRIKKSLGKSGGKKEIGYFV
jgi:hypothetical protein